MAITVTNIGTASSKSGTNLVITVPAGGVPAGSLIVICSYTGIQFADRKIIDTAGNLYRDTTFTTINYTYNSLALNQNDTISFTFNDQPMAISAFYATGIQTDADPFDHPTVLSHSGEGTNPNATGIAPSVADSLVIAELGTYGPVTDAFTQDTANGWSAPPVRVGTSGGSAKSNITVAGGWAIKSDAPVYNPTIRSRPWWVLFAAFKPAP